jgi:hypothetical protein
MALRIEMMMMTTRSSMSVKACFGCPMRLPPWDGDVQISEVWLRFMAITA